MAILHGNATFPGIFTIESCSYTISHGISPGIAVIVCSPQLTLPSNDGTLTITDGNGTIILPGCRFDSLVVNQDSGGTYWTIQISDRRWRWRNLGIIQGCYNQVDLHSKLIPWTIRSPQELAALCLAAIGETGYQINLPEGLSYPGPFTHAPIVNITGTNTPVNWYSATPAQALQELADQYSCHVIYQWSTDSVYVGPLGEGEDLPLNGVSVSHQGPSLKNPETPDSIAVLGSPTRYQALLQLTAVGEDWDGSIRPIDLLTYAPVSPSTGLPQISVITLLNPTVGITWIINIAGKSLVTPSDGTGTGTSSAGLIVSAINAAAPTGVGNLVKAVVTGSSATTATITITGLQQGVPFALDEVRFSPSDSASDVDWNMTQAAVLGGNIVDWTHTQPPDFSAVREVVVNGGVVLTQVQAQILAAKTVYKYYGVVNQSPTGTGPINIPGFGNLLRREQLVIEGTQVDQVVPMPGDQNIQDDKNPIDPEQPFLVDFYNGYSRDKPAAVYGSVVSELNNGITFVDQEDQDNTDPTSQVFIPFTLDSTRFLIGFTDYAYTVDEDGLTQPGDFTLLTAVQVRDPITNQLISYSKVIPLGGLSLTNPRVYFHPDVQLNIMTQYSPLGFPDSTYVLEQDPLIRADSYLQAHLQEYQLVGGQTVAYNGIIPLDVDGAIQQITWVVDSTGASTKASRNSEHSVWIPTYAERRRAEFLDPVQRIRIGPDDQVDMPNQEGPK